MNNRPVKLIAADMDGTLLDPAGRLPAGFFDMYTDMRRRGIRFVAASGRQYYNLLKLFDSIKDEIIFVAENGTYVMDRTRELLVVDINPEDVSRVITEVRDIDGAFPVLCGKRMAYIEDTLPAFVDQARTYYERCEIVPDLLDVTDDQFLKVAVYDFKGSATNSYPLMRHFDDTLKVVVSGHNWLDVSRQDANKGNALRLVQEYLSIAPEECVAFGDQMNDAEMLRAVGRGYAMANASDELKRVASLLAPSNDEAGVLTVVRDLLATAP